MANPHNRKARVGIWLVGAYGGVGTTTAVGVASLARDLVPPTGMATVLPEFAHIDFVGMGDIVIGGHEIRHSSFLEACREMQTQSAFPPATLVNSTQDLLDEWSGNTRPGVIRLSGDPVEKMANWTAPLPGVQRPRDVVSQLSADIREFGARYGLDRVIVVNVGSTEPPVGLELMPRNDAELAASLDDCNSRLPASSLYAIAAVKTGCGYVNFTPSFGLGCPSLQALAQSAKVPFCGADAKTGETLLKAVLAPMFARRNLRVLSWVGHNILGNRDGEVLQNSQNKRGKVESKSHLLSSILGFAPESIISIEHVASLGDWKTAWDHVHFAGFLGTKMTLQFTWQGADSPLGAPLVMDLVRWTELAMRRGEFGCLRHLASYFKSPLQVSEQDFFKQWMMLEEYALRDTAS